VPRLPVPDRPNTTPGRDTAPWPPAPPDRRAWWRGRRGKSNPEGLAAAAGLLGVGILEHEARLHHRFGVVQHRAFQEEHALVVHDHLDALVLENLVLGGDVGLSVEVDLVGHARAAAPGHAQAQHAAPGIGLLLEKMSHAVGGALRNSYSHVYPSSLILRSDRPV